MNLSFFKLLFSCIFGHRNAKVTDTERIIFEGRAFQAGGQLGKCSRWWHVQNA
jgi:hypothetical protein